MSGATLLTGSLSLILVLGLIIAIAYGFKFLSQKGFLSFSGKRTHRLKILENLVIDDRRRLLLLQRDTTSHLLLLSPQGDVVIETHIPLLQEDSPSQTNEELSQSPPLKVKCASINSPQEPPPPLRLKVTDV